MQLESSICDEQRIFKYSKELSDKLLLGESGLFIKGEVIRLVGVGVSKLDDGSYQQISLFDDGLISSSSPSPTGTPPLGAANSAIPAAGIDRERQKKLDAMTKKLQDEFGKGIIKRGGV
jgi:DNA polymerase-4